MYVNFGRRWLYKSIRKNKKMAALFESAGVFAQARRWNSFTVAEEYIENSIPESGSKY